MTVRSTLLWGALALVLCVAGYVWVKKNIEWVEVEIDGPTSVKARKHELLAASRYLNKLGYQTENIDSSDFYNTLSPVTDTILLQTLPDSLPEDAYDRLLNWVQRGGHLMVGLSGVNEGDAPVEFMESLGITHTREFEKPAKATVPHAIANDRGTYPFVIEGLSADDSLVAEMDLQHMFALLAGTPVSMSGQVQGLFAFAQMEFGSGRVTVFADPHFWGNEQIGFRDNARLLAASIASYSAVGSTIHISDRNTNLPGVFTMLWQRWQWLCLLMIVLGLALLRQAWVRFGPIHKLPEVRSNNFARHLLAVAQFQGRHQSIDQLLDPARQRVLNRFISGVGQHQAVPLTSTANDSGIATDSQNVLPASAAVAPGVEVDRSELLCRVQQVSGVSIEQLEDALFNSANQASIVQIAHTLQTLDRRVKDNRE